MPALMKILSHEYLEHLLDGNLYMNGPAFFRQCDKSDTVRSDEDEGLQSCIQFEKLEVEEDGAWLPISAISPALLRTNNSASFNMFCMYGISLENDARLDARCLAFGDTFVVITDPDEFTRRVGKAANKIQKAAVIRPVEYVNCASYHGDMGPFRKFSGFHYQQEIRLVMYDVGNEPFILAIGDIRDICLHGRSDEFNKRLIRVTAKPE